ncbi:Aste57867_261 [Aphanomyces stellatus]|uniref:Aste57867_261 protein n=1 Tax=Aphanomyces stellatus TaxID=120398 RepID=A0A485K254_9STRA|nr:hypothetical protein As57867_000261 [Aphanomyces stellatus]VFT77487.1 Aste57867_261 [Aphanomyces stellatus]
MNANGALHDAIGGAMYPPPPMTNYVPPTHHSEHMHQNHVPPTVTSPPQAHSPTDASGGAMYPPPPMTNYVPPTHHSEHMHQNHAPPTVPSPPQAHLPVVSNAPLATEDEYFKVAESFGLMKQLGSEMRASQTAFPTDIDLSERMHAFSTAVGFHLKSGTTGGTTRVYNCKSGPNCPFLITTNISKSTGIARISRRLYCFRHNHALESTSPSFTWRVVDAAARDAPTLASTHGKRPHPSSSRDLHPAAAVAVDPEDTTTTTMVEPAPPQVCTEAEYFAVARALGICKRAGPSSVRPTSKVFASKDDLLDRIIFLAVKTGFQIKHRDGTFQYMCKSVADCPFTLSINVRPSGTAKLSEKICYFAHSHPLGVLGLPAEGKNTTLNSSVIAYSIAASGMDWPKATHHDFRHHCIATFGVPIGPTRSTTVRRELERLDLQPHVDKYKMMDATMRAALDRVRAHATANPRPAEGEDVHVMRREMQHRWEMDRRRIVLDEQRHARAEEDARVQHRVLVAKLHQAEVQFKVAQAKAKQELLAAGLSAADADAALAP